MPHFGPSRACASFAPTMSVRIFGHFEQFSTFPARRALCSAHPCTPDAWTNGPYMTWVLCILVPMVHTPHGRSRAIFVKVLAQSECGQFCHFGICGPNWDCHHAKSHGDLRKPSAWESMLDSRWMAYGMADPISKPAWRYTIESTPESRLISSSQNDPLLGPQFNPPVWSIGHISGTEGSLNVPLGEHGEPLLVGLGAPWLPGTRLWLGATPPLLAGFRGPD